MATIKGAYYPSWAQDTFPPSSINTAVFTHVYYAFLIPDATTFQFQIDPQTQPLLHAFTDTLHAANPPITAILSIGGGSAGADLFARMASTPASRAAFISSSIQVAREYGFDGLDLDWEYPQNSTDMQNLGLLLQEWRAQVNQEAGDNPPLLLVAAVHYAATIAYLNNATYPSVSITSNLDWINLMTYDYRGSWDTSATGAHAALYDPNSNLSTSFGLNSWIQAGVPKSKLIMGLPLYGRTWQLRDPNVNGIGAPAVGVGPGQDGTMIYSQVVEFNANNGAQETFDQPTVSVYSVAGTSWIGYDNVRSATEKIDYARGLGIRGYFFWAANGDYQWTISQAGPCSFTTGRLTLSKSPLIAISRKGLLCFKNICGV